MATALTKSEVRNQPTPNPDRGGEVGDLSFVPKIFRHFPMEWRDPIILINPLTLR
ncbi:MAG: hypothetical protein F6K23_21920 [Okeania sp. SIO2C9]|uniref:hypothetical protein n=1 Tax=Okeania sp. SIO2C9 TaxID=2607791 RepID=UPI0013BED7EC|nr:hypothetical protein [Okeania sp. SIO2C9]NEQ75476.1 hypothetical protein [Okeania sp. SIO2C9]